MINGKLSKWIFVCDLGFWLLPSRHTFW